MTDTNLYSSYEFWKCGSDLAVQVYKHTIHFPKSELFGLTNQIRRSAFSVPSNLAEGFGRKSPKDKERFYHIAMGSLFELQIQLEIAEHLEFINHQDIEKIEPLITKLRKLIHGMLKSTHKKSESLTDM